MIKFLAVVFLALLIPACSVTPDKPKDTGKKAAASKAREPDWRPPTHLVKKGDTLYAIALEYGYDYKELAEINGITPPYLIRIGQTLKLASQPPQTQQSQESQAAVATPLKPSAAGENRVSLPVNDKLKNQPKPVKIPWSAEAENAIKPEPVPTKVVSAPVVQDVKQPESKPAESKPAPAMTEEKKSPPPADEDDLDWAWPSRGKLVASFNESNNAKGIDIAGKPGQPVMAAESGKVVYSGSGLRGYGKLVIIKHNKTFLSAYAHNSQILVKEGQSVTKGQRIAEMGNSDADQVKLHFEIRRLGKPVDPLRYLGEL